MQRLASVRYRSAFGPALLAAVFLLAGCTRTVVPRLDIAFDADPLGQPTTSPSPTPPNDLLASYPSEGTSLAVVGNPAGGRWLRITPGPQFVASPDQRRLSIIAWSERFATNPPAQIRGRMRLRVDGPGTVTVGFRPAQGAGFIGGVQLISYPNAPRGEVHVVREFSRERIDDIYPLPTSGAKIADYRPGSVIDISWSIDQASRTLYIGAGGPSESTTFRAVSNGVATTPVQTLSLWVWLERPSSNTVVYVDRLYAEEYR